MTTRDSHAEETRQCGYHLGPDVEGCRLVQLRANCCGRIEWSRWAIWACPDCRKHLRGVFRYANASQEWALHGGAFRGPDELAQARN